MSAVREKGHELETIYFPLRSNAGWFAREENLKEMEGRIKMSMLIYDTLIFEDGHYRCGISENGSFDVHLPPGQVPEEERIVRFFPPGSDFRIELKRDGSSEPWVPVSGPSVAMYCVDYFPLLKQAGLLGQEYVRCVRPVISEQGKCLVREASAKDQAEADFWDKLPGNQFLKSNVANSLYYDSLVAHDLRLPFCVDARVGQYVSLKSRSLHEALELRIPVAVYNRLVELIMPDYSNADWDFVQKIRESAPGEELRTVFARMTRSVLRHLSGLREDTELDDLINCSLVQELVREIGARRKSPGKLILDIALNLLPLGVGGLASTGKDIYEAIQERRSWVNLLSPPCKLSRGGKSGDASFDSSGG